MTDQINRVVLAYSGGLDTSVILKWLQQTYRCEVVTFTADLGQGEELEPARRKAEQAGVKPEHIFIDDLREEFVGNYVFPMMRANALYEGLYLLGTSIARPLIGAPAWLLDGIFIGATRGRALRNAAIVATALYIATDLLLRPFGPDGIWWALTASYFYRAMALGAYLPALLRTIEVAEIPPAT